MVAQVDTYWLFCLWNYDKERIKMYLYQAEEGNACYDDRDTYKLYLAKYNRRIYFFNQICVLQNLVHGDYLVNVIWK